MNILNFFFNFQSFFNGSHQLLYQVIGLSQIITMLEQCHFNVNRDGVTLLVSKPLLIGQTVRHWPRFPLVLLVLTVTVPLVCKFVKPEKYQWVDDESNADGRENKVSSGKEHFLNVKDVTPRLQLPVMLISAWLVLSIQKVSMFVWLDVPMAARFWVAKNSNSNANVQEV